MEKHIWIQYFRGDSDLLCHLSFTIRKNFRICHADHLCKQWFDPRTKTKGLEELPWPLGNCRVHRKLQLRLSYWNPPNAPILCQFSLLQTQSHHCSSRSCLFLPAGLLSKGNYSAERWHFLYGRYWILGQKTVHCNERSVRTQWANSAVANHCRGGASRYHSEWSVYRA